MIGTIYADIWNNGHCCNRILTTVQMTRSMKQLESTVKTSIDCIFNCLRTHTTQYLLRYRYIIWTIKIKIVYSLFQICLTHCLYNYIRFTILFDLVESNSVNTTHNNNKNHTHTHWQIATFIRINLINNKWKFIIEIDWKLLVYEITNKIFDFPPIFHFIYG